MCITLAILFTFRSSFYCGLLRTSFFIFVLLAADCLGVFNDFRVVCGERVVDRTQYIIPELNFSCDGNVTQWKVGLEGGDNDRKVNLQIWRPVGPGEYTRVTEVVYTKTVADERIATVPVSMSVKARDMVGFYVRRRQLQPHTLTDLGLTMYSRMGGSAQFLNNLTPVVGPSPYISVVFGEFFVLFRQHYSIYAILSLCKDNCKY